MLPSLITANETRFWRRTDFTNPVIEMGSAVHFIAESCAMFGGNLYASRASVGRILEGFGNGPETNSFECGSF